MKDIRSIHKEAVELVKKANDLFAIGKKEEYITAIEQAFNLEQEAAMELLLNVDSEPTRSVIFRSAANLAYLCGKYLEADKLIHFALAGTPFEEIKIEILELQTKVQLSLNIKPAKEEIYENAYIEFLKQNAVNIRIEPKTSKYSKAIAISYIVDFLKNIQASYLNFSDVNFIKSFTDSDFNNLESIHKCFIHDTNLLGVEFKFNSFGISIAADTGIMNYNLTNSPKFKEFSSRLFTDFIDDVLKPDLNSNNFKKTITEKYTDEERRKIFSPIIPSLIDKSPYNVSIANENFTSNIKSFKPITRETKLFLSPATKNVNEGIEISLIRKTEQKRGLKSKTIIVEELKHAEFQINISNIIFEGKKVYLNEPHSYAVVFSDNHYTIDDEYYNIFTQSDDYNKILIDYEKLFIEKYDYLLSNQNMLNQTDLELLQRFEKTSLRDW
jgi:hypothetical protein